MNAWLIQEGGLDPLKSQQRGLVVHSKVDFFSSMAYPAVAELGLRVENIGRSSVKYGVGIFQRGQEEARAAANLVHVFVDVNTGKPSPTGLPEGLRESLVTHLVVDTQRQSRL